MLPGGNFILDDADGSRVVSSRIKAMKHAFTISCVATAIAFACAPQLTGYDASDPTKLTCPCDDPQTCYESAARLDEQGETAETGEQLLELAQCACFEGSVAGCNTLAHFAKDWVAACDGTRHRSCTIAGFVHGTLRACRKEAEKPFIVIRSRRVLRSTRRAKQVLRSRVALTANSIGDSDRRLGNPSVLGVNITPHDGRLVVPSRS